MPHARGPPLLSRQPLGDGQEADRGVRQHSTPQRWDSHGWRHLRGQRMADLVESTDRRAQQAL
eukprot:41110-Ditylum_brightwellii.AAC.1